VHGVGEAKHEAGPIWGRPRVVQQYRIKLAKFRLQQAIASVAAAIDHLE